MYAVQYSHEVGVYTMAKSDWHSCGTICLLAACATTPQFTAQDCCYGNSSTTGYNV